MKKQTIAVDFDGVIHKYSFGWKGGDMKEYYKTHSGFWKGKKQSEETKKKNSDSVKRSWERRRLEQKIIQGDI